MENQVVPLMIHFKRSSEDSRGDLRYDEATQLNLAFHAGERMPAVLVHGALADMKTLRKSGGGGED